MTNAYSLYTIAQEARDLGISTTRHGMQIHAYRGVDTGGCADGNWPASDDYYDACDIYVGEGKDAFKVFEYATRRDWWGPIRGGHWIKEGPWKADLAKVLKEIKAEIEEKRPIVEADRKRAAEEAERAKAAAEKAEEDRLLAIYEAAKNK